MRTVSGITEHVVVVGAGLSGLAAALRLAGRGRRVTVVERESHPGGRAGRLDRDGYRLDTGPTVLTMPDIVADTLAAVGDDLAARLPLARLDPAYRAEFADGSGLDVYSDGDAMQESVAAFAGRDEAAGYRRLREWMSKLYRVEFDRFIAANADSPLSLLTPDLARLAALGGFRKLDRVIGRFLSDERLRRVFSFQSLYAGEAPQRALALYAVISYMDTVAGVYFPLGGMRALPDALAAAAADAGVTFRYQESVTELRRTGSRIDAVRTSQDEQIPCDAVVLSTELDTAYRLLERTPRRILPLRAAPSAVVLHLGSRRRWDSSHHTLLFGAAWESTFREIITDGTLMSDPSLLVTRPTATDPALAPGGEELLYVLAPAPNTQRGHVDWSSQTEHCRDEIMQAVETRLLPGLGDGLTFSHLVTPEDWAREGLMAGSPFSLAHTFAQTGPFRPRNLPRGVDNAVLAGCGTTPGVGVPTALISGRLAADRVTGPSHAGRVSASVIANGGAR